jgi:hypothetical protein
MMADQVNGGRRVAGNPRRSRSRRRWAIAAAVVGVWLCFLAVAGSLPRSLALLLIVVAFTAVLVCSLRSLGIGRDQAGRPQHPPHALLVSAGAGARGAHDGLTRCDLDKMIMTGPARGLDLPPNPLLRLVTGGTVAQTRVSGAHAGRGRGAQLLLPGELTVSRLHARFTCDAGEWRMTGLGHNGVVLNGQVVTGEQVIRDGDCIQWGRQAGAPRSRVEIR